MQHIRTLMYLKLNLSTEHLYCVRPHLMNRRSQTIVLCGFCLYIPILRRVMGIYMYITSILYTSSRRNENKIQNIKSLYTCHSPRLCSSRSRRPRKSQSRSRETVVKTNPTNGPLLYYSSRNTI